MSHSHEQGVEGADNPYPIYDASNERQSLLPVTTELPHTNKHREAGDDGDDDDDEDDIIIHSSEKIHSNSNGLTNTSNISKLRRSRFDCVHVILAFTAGALSLLLIQLGVCGLDCLAPRAAPSATGNKVAVLGQPWAGSTEVHNFPPASPTNAFPELFPTNVGYPGETPTGAEAGVIETAPTYPIHTGAPHLVVPDTLGGSASESSSGKKFDLFKQWGNLSPWYSVDRTAFGLDTSPTAPETCKVTGLHFLHRHGARYPTAWASYGGPANFSGRLNAVAEKWEGSGDLEFMNEWTYKLGEEVLTPYGRQQLFDLGVSMRLKYGFLLEGFSKTNTIPVFRTESQDRMLASALNFAIGFFGYPLEGKYQQLITIESSGFNNTLAPYTTCPNANDRDKSERGFFYVKRWAHKYLQNALARLRPQLKGFSLTIEDVYVMQQMCAYETVAVGYSRFCHLFTQEEWEGFSYALDLAFWYNNAFGSPTARIQGVGWVKEFLARLTHTPLTVHDTSTNKTIHDNKVWFPLDQPLYVDATHEVVVLNIITALNLTRFAEDGPLPDDHILPNRKFRVSELAPFATNIQFQLLECDSHPSTQIRIIINDGVVPLTGIRGCPEDKDGLCPLDTFIRAQQALVEQTSWEWACHGDWELPPGDAWTTVTGDPPARA